MSQLVTTVWRLAMSCDLLWQIGGWFYTRRYLWPSCHKKSHFVTWVSLKNCCYWPHTSVNCKPQIKRRNDPPKNHLIKFNWTSSEFCDRCVRFFSEQSKRRTASPQSYKISAFIQTSWENSLSTQLQNFIYDLPNSIYSDFFTSVNYSFPTLFRKKQKKQGVFQVSFLDEKNIGPLHRHPNHHHRWRARPGCLIGILMSL